MTAKFKSTMTKIDFLAEPGSFRDPSGTVFYHGGSVYRSVDDRTFALMQRLRDDGLLRRLAADRLIVKTDLVPDGGDLERGLREVSGAKGRFLAHETVPFISYPYEWSVCMLADAGILHLELQTRLLERGYSLKDATAFNVAFIGGRPVFIDLPSIEIPRRLDVWVAYGQFCRMFVFPILLHRYRGLGIRECFLGALEGPSVTDTRRMLGFRNSLRPPAFVDVFLQNLLHGAAQKRIARKTQDAAGLSRATSSAPQSGHPCAAGPSPAAGDQRVQVLNLKRLRNKLTRLTGRHAAHSAWSSYEQTHSYDTAGDDEKVDFIKENLSAMRPRLMLDLGCNTGRYSRLAVDAGAAVTAIDADHDCIDLLYRRVRGQSPNLLPLCMDIADPSPPRGFRHRERKSFEERCRFDAVMALALIHHLLVSARIPLTDLRDMFWSLTREWLIVEFVAVHDPMFQQLLALRENYYQDLTPDAFESVFDAKFTIVTRREIMQGRRVLYGMKRKEAV